MPRSSKKKKPLLAPARKPPLAFKDIEINDDFARAIEALERTRGSLFITGRAGTGKSTLLRYFKETTSKKIVILASTGIAAIQVGGQTIHSFFMLPPRFVQPEDVKVIGRNRKLIESLDAVVIDEASMVRADVMDAIDLSLRLNRRRQGTPFGGVQMILFGDLHQLPPVIEPQAREVYKLKYKSPFFFHANVFRDVRVERIELTKIYRQKEARFVDVLNRIREQKHDASDLELLNRRVVDDGTRHDHITLTTTNRDAAAINRTRLEAIAYPAYEYAARVTGKFEESAYPNDERLVLKRGAQVMMIKNDIEEKRWVNGTLAHVADLSENSITVEIDGARHEVPTVSWDRYQYVLDETGERVAQEVVGTFTQYPLKLAWAITIHKSQGQTFENVVIDTGEGVFAHGQLYVALSRCTKLQGIRLKRSIRPTDVRFDGRILDFNEKGFGDWLFEEAVPF